MNRLVVIREHTRVIKLRLKRMGAKKRPSYRIVVADSKSPRDGRFIESIGYYDPIAEPKTLKIDDERAKHWLSVGAQPTDTVKMLLKKQGIGADAA
jgi:small subunit ribosomal protein S16